jgi:hypothetical protein
MIDLLGQPLPAVGTDWIAGEDGLSGDEPTFRVVDLDPPATIRIGTSGSAALALDLLIVKLAAGPARPSPVPATPLYTDAIGAHRFSSLTARR